MIQNTERIIIKDYFSMSRTSTENRRRTNNAPKFARKNEDSAGASTVTTPISPMHSTVLRQPSASTGHLMAMHHHHHQGHPHSLINNGTPHLILRPPQGFAVTSQAQMFNECLFGTRHSIPITAHQLPAAVNDAPLEFKLQNPSVPATGVTDSGVERNTNQNGDLKNDQQNSSNGSAEKQKSATITVDVESEREDSDTSEASFNRLMSFPVFGVNQLLPNAIDSSLLVSQFGMFGNVIPQVPVSKASSIEVNNQSSNPSSSTLQILHFKYCTLFPPNPNAPAPTTRDRPAGCKTAFIGGLPDNIKEEIVREVFGPYGEIVNLRLSNKKFAHVRYLEEKSVDEALVLSGYRMRIGSNVDAASSGRLHVDYAHARDDQYEFECKQRQSQRELRHRERMLLQKFSPPSPTRYTDSEANVILERLKGEETFLNAISITVCWLDRGECNKKNVNTFYNMIQSVNAHVRRLLIEKNQCESEFEKVRDRIKIRAQLLYTQFSQIEKLFASSSHKKVWDHFTKAQRKNIELWKKSTVGMKKFPFELDEKGSDEMDLSDSDEESDQTMKRRKLDTSETNALKDENDNLRCQLEAYKNEICVVRSELQAEVTKKTEEMNLIKEALSAVQQELEISKQQEKSQKYVEVEATANAVASSLVEREAKLVGLISMFLHVHPFGAGVDYICSFLEKTVPSLKVTEIEQFMSKFPSVFQQQLVGIGANMERRWKFAGFSTI